MNFFLLLFTCEPNSSPPDKFWFEATPHRSLNIGTCHLFCQYFPKILLKEDNEITIQRASKTAARGQQ